MTLGTRGVLMVLAGVAGGVACGGGSDSNGPSGPPMTSTVIVAAANAFQPLFDTVKVGGTITWAWATNSLDHNIISTGATSFPDDGNEVLPGTGTSGNDFFSAPHSYQYTFATAGRYAYYCSTHGTTGGGGGNTGMHGTIDVIP